MKFTTAITALSITLLSSSSGAGRVQALLRGSEQDDENYTITQQLQNIQQSIKNTDSSCLSITEEDKCNGSTDDDGIACVWCKCSAVPSECLNVDQASKVPAGVFDCASSPSKEGDTTDTPAVTAKKVQAMKHANDADKSYDGSFLNYSLSDSEVNGELCDPSSKSLAGYVDITGSQYDANGENKHLFYWFFEKRASSSSKDTKKDVVEDDTTPLILWLTGGPGCSSTLALLTENGPCSVNEDGSGTEVNPYSWTEAAHVLWLDQPAGVGYSYGDQNDYNEEMISEDAFYFLQGFFKAHPEYASNPLFVVGESYGGHYAPSIAHKVWTKNNSGDDSLMKINLAGLAVGNGLTDPQEQYKWYGEMAYKNSHGIHTVTEDTYNAMTDAVPKCTALIEKCNGGDGFINKFACQSAFLVCNAALTSPYQMTGLNPYDIRKKCGNNPLCYDFSNIEKWLNLDETKSALSVKEDAHWATCNMGINMKFHTDWMKDFSPFVKDLINAGIPSLIYAGDVDFICNYMGNKAWTLALDWDHKDDFNNAQEKEWGTHEDGSAATLVRSSNGFTFMQVYDAGHMVPSDQPEVALEMIKTFISGGNFE